MATNGRRRTKGAGSIIHRKDGSWEFRREVGALPHVAGGGGLGALVQNHALLLKDRKSVV